MSTLRAANRALLRRKRRWIVNAGDGRDGRVGRDAIATALKNLEALGYTCSKPLIERFSQLSRAEFVALYSELGAALRAERGADAIWQPMYPNFPQQVMAASEAELYFNALFHYIGDVIGARIMPQYSVDPRPELIDRPEPTVIDLGNEDELRQIARDLIGANTSLSADDKQTVVDLLNHFRLEIETVLPESIPYKENLAFTAAYLLDRGFASDDLLARHFRTATDLLRLAVACSKGDVSLAEPTKFRPFRRAERRVLLALLDRVDRPDEDLWRYRDRWLRLGERLHPGDYTDTYPAAAAAFARLRSGERPLTFNGAVERAVRSGDVPAALARLRTRPGELARRLDHLLRIGDPTQQQRVIEAFTAVCSDVATPVLLQVMTHFEHRSLMESVRPVFPKGNAAKVQAVPNRLPELGEALSAAVVAACESALRARFAALPPLGTVWLDPRLTKYNVPFSQRSASKALRTLVRGSRVPFAPGNTLRFFLWWKEGMVDQKPTGRVDIDLSGMLYAADFRFVDHISWTNLRSGRFRGAHSGDITSAPDGACEFIDLDVDSVLAFGARYVVVTAYSFTHQPYCNLPECFVGWMMRSAPASGEIFEPSTVVDRVDLSAKLQACVPAVFDLVTREMIWVDVGYGTDLRTSATVANTMDGVGQMLRAMVLMHKTSLHRLFALHAEARGTRIDAAVGADTVFSVDAGITPRDLERIMSEFMA